MEALFKTLFGGIRIILVSTLALLLGFIVLRTPAAAFAGIIVPLALLAGAGYLARW